MSDETKDGDPAADPAKGADEGGKPAKGASNEVDPVAEAARVAGAKAQAAAKDKQKFKDFLESLSPEQRKQAEAFASKAVNDYRDSAIEKGEFITQADYEKSLRTEFVKFRETLEAQAAAKEAMLTALAERNILPGTEGYKKFTAEMNSGFYDLKGIAKPELVDRIAKAAQAGVYAPKDPVPSHGEAALLGGGEVSIQVGKDKEGKVSFSTESPTLTRAKEILAALPRGR